MSDAPPAAPDGTPPPEIPPPAPVPPPAAHPHKSSAYALALGATERGAHYMAQYPGFGGKLLFLACTGAVFMAGAKILDCLKHERRVAERPETVF